MRAGTPCLGLVQRFFQRALSRFEKGTTHFIQAAAGNEPRSKLALQFLFEREHPRPLFPNILSRPVVDMREPSALQLTLPAAFKTQNARESYVSIVHPAVTMNCRS